MFLPPASFDKFSLEACPFAGFLPLFSKVYSFYLEQKRIISTKEKYNGRVRTDWVFSLDVPGLS